MMDSIPESWALTTLGKVAVWGSGGTPSRTNPKFYLNGNIPWIKTGELGNKYIHRAEEFITKEALAGSAAKLFPKGSVGIAMYGATIGKVSIWGIEASTNQACAVAQPYEDILFNEYLYYFLFSQQRNFVNAGKGGAQPNISQGVLKGWPIPLAPLNEQKRIVAKIEELFSELDKGIESLKAAREQLKVYRQAVIKSAYEGKITSNWRKRNKVTADWGAEPIGDLCEINPKHVGINDSTEISFVPMDRLNQETAEIDEHITRPFGEVKKGYTHFANNDVLFAKITPCMENGKNGIARNLKNGLGCGSTEFFVFRCSDRILPEFLLLKFRDTLFRRRAEANMTGAVGQRRVPKSWIEKTILPVPSIEEQRQIISEVKEVFDRILRVEVDIEHNLNRSEHLRQAILKKAFSGQLVGQNAKDEPASALLERLDVENEAPKAKAKKKRSAA
jgi:type I restriction enzyme, S subunit